MALNLPYQYELPEGMEDAMMVYELNLRPSDLETISENLLRNMMVYKAAKTASQNL